MDEKKINIPDDWMIDFLQLTDEQREIINDFDCSFIVEGPAGSGKTVIATYKYLECIGVSGVSDTAILVYTKALAMFIKSGLDMAVRQGIVNSMKAKPDQIMIKHIDGARKLLERDSYEFMILDEAQDITSNDFDNLFDACEKVMLFGDDDQKLYSEDRVSLAEIKKRHSSKIKTHYKLTDHYRTPRKIIEYASKIINKPEMNLYSKSPDLDTKPDIRKFTCVNEEIQAVANVIKQYNLKKVGIFVNSNPSINNVRDIMSDNGIECNYKEYENVNLNFNNRSKPTILTYHSAKGVQFENVFVIHCGTRQVYATPDNDFDNYQNALYVSCTRTTKRLFVFYTGQMNAFMEYISI